MDYFVDILKLNQMNRTLKGSKSIKFKNLQGYSNNIKLGNVVLHTPQELYNYLLKHSNVYIENIELLNDTLFVKKINTVTGIEIRQIVRLLSDTHGKIKVFIKKVENIDTYLAKRVLLGVIDRIEQEPYGTLVMYKDNKAELLTEYMLKVKGTNFELMEARCLEYLYIDNLDISDIPTMNFLFWNDFSLKHVELRNFNASKITSMINAFKSCQKLESCNIETWCLSKYMLENLYGSEGLPNIICKKVCGLLCGVLLWGQHGRI